MNYVIKVKNREQYTVYGVRHTADGFAVRSTTVAEGNRVLDSVGIAILPSLQKANEMAFRTALLKAELKNRIVVDDPPAFVKAHYEADDKLWVSNQQMLDLLEASKQERYVVFQDVVGLEGRFDLGVQYLAIDNGDSDTLMVTDNFGEACSCFVSRFASVEKTEVGREVEIMEVRRQERVARKQSNEMRKGNKVLR